MPIANYLLELIQNGSTILPSNRVKEFNEVANAHSLNYEIGPHVAGQSVSITI